MYPKVNKIYLLLARTHNLIKASQLKMLNICIFEPTMKQTLKINDTVSFAIQI